MGSFYSFLTYIKVKEQGITVIVIVIAIVMIILRLNSYTIIVIIIIIVVIDIIVIVIVIIMHRICFNLWNYVFYFRLHAHSYKNV